MCLLCCWCLLFQPDDAAEDTPTLDKPTNLDISSAGTTSHKPPPSSLDGDDSKLDRPTHCSIAAPASSRSQVVDKSTVGQNDALKNHTLFTLTDHTSPTSPCSSKSADDNGDQKLSTPGAVSSGYGSATSGYGGYGSTQAASSDDLLGDHDDVTNHGSMVVTNDSSMLPTATAAVSIIDAAVPSDLDSPLKPTTPYTEEPAVAAALTSDEQQQNVDSVSTLGSDGSYCSKQELNKSTTEQHSAVELPSAKRDRELTVLGEADTVSDQAVNDERGDHRAVNDGDVDSSVKMNGSVCDIMGRTTTDDSPQSGVIDTESIISSVSSSSSSSCVAQTTADDNHVTQSSIVTSSVKLVATSCRPMTEDMSTLGIISVQLHCEPRKLRHWTFVCNLAKC